VQCCLLLAQLSCSTFFVLCVVYTINCSVILKAFRDDGQSDLQGGAGSRVQFAGEESGRGDTGGSSSGASTSMSTSMARGWEAPMRYVTCTLIRKQQEVWPCSLVFPDFSRPAAIMKWCMWGGDYGFRPRYSLSSPTVHHFMFVSYAACWQAFNSPRLLRCCGFCFAQGLEETSRRPGATAIVELGLLASSCIMQWCTLDFEWRHGGPMACLNTQYAPLHVFGCAASCL
jgi:hypothetical protein